MKNFLLISLVGILFSQYACEKCPVCPAEDDGKVHLISPSNGQQDVWAAPIFKLCALPMASEYQIQIVQNTFPDFAILAIDTITTQNEIKLHNQVLFYNGNFIDVPFLSAGLRYKWRARAKINGIFTDWSNTYTFKVASPKDGLIGTYSVTKYRYWHGYSMFGYCPGLRVCRTYLGTSEITVSKNTNGTGIIVAEKGNTTAPTQLYDEDQGGFSFKSYREYGRAMDAKFEPDRDSFHVEYQTRGLSNTDSEEGYLFVGAIRR
jgi:hypothetical protein